MVCRQTVTASSPATVAGVNPLEKELLFRILDRLVTGWYRCLSKRIESGTQGATGRKYASGKEGGAGEHTATNYESVAGNQRFRGEASGLKERPKRRQGSEGKAVVETASPIPSPKGSG